MLTQEDKEFLAQKGISEEKLNAQLENFKTGFPFLKLAGAAAPGKGITIATETEKQDYLAAWNAYLEGDGKVLKFVPASGAASRMFKDLFEFLDGDRDVPANPFIEKFFANIHDFAFYAELDAALIDREGKSIDTLISEKKYKTIVDYLLNKQGLSYGKLPKGLLLFHNYPKGARTPLEEHLVEGALYAGGKTGEVNVHFTVSPEHRELFQTLVAEKSAEYALAYHVKYNVTFSEQKASTDTVAANPDNTPFRTEDGKILFRPGGHGALIENLNDLDADIIYIKNIDNVVPDRLKPETVEYKKLIAGVLVTKQK